MHLAPTCQGCGSSTFGVRTGYPNVGNVCDACLSTLGAPPETGPDGGVLNNVEVNTRLATLAKKGA